MFDTFTNAELASIFNAAIEAHSLPAQPVKRFASKKVAIAHLEATMEEFGLSFDGGALVQPAPDADFDPESATDVEDEKVPAEDFVDETAEGMSQEVLDALEPAPFVKLPKDQLPPRGTPERAAYRKARRAAARAARKAREAAE